MSPNDIDINEDCQNSEENKMYDVEKSCGKLTMIQKLLLRSKQRAKQNWMNLFKLICARNQIIKKNQTDIKNCKNHGSTEEESDLFDVDKSYNKPSSMQKLLLRSKERAKQNWMKLFKITLARKMKVEPTLKKKKSGFLSCQVHGVERKRQTVISQRN